MDQDDIVDKLVTENRQDPRNKIIIDGHDLSAFASEELDTSVTVSTLSQAVSAHKNGTSDEKDQALVDAATALCHQVADRVWGECLDREDDEWEEIDISTAWSASVEQETEGLTVVVRPM